VIQSAPDRLNGAACDPALASRIRVFVDGDMLRCVTAYDIPAGWVEIIAHGDNGFLQHCDGEWVTRRVHGKIRAVLMPDREK
jgi:hypothetical protein